MSMEKNLFKKILTFNLIFILILSLTTISLANDFKIKIGNVIEILVYGHEELSRPVMVKPEGTVDFPFLQNIPIDGLTIDELREIIVIQLSKYMNQKPLVSVILLETYPIEVTVLGRVFKPGAHQIKVNSTIQGAIGQAGGFLPGANLTEVKIIRKDYKSDTKEEFFINLEKFLVTGDPDSLPQLKNGDVIMVPSYSGPSTVKVLGEVYRPGSFEINYDNDSLLDIIFMAGGLTKEANIKKVKLISINDKNKQEITIDLYTNFTSDDYKKIPKVKPGDIIFIPKKVFSWNKFIRLMRDITVFATLWVLLERSKQYN